jgi:anaphase-promoting complex subunit 3
MFEKARKLEPFRTEGMEIYSTILWQMRKEIELSFLANQLLEIDRTCAESWCALGNCFSLQKEHELAIKFFQRVIIYYISLIFNTKLFDHIF